MARGYEALRRLFVAARADVHRSFIHRHPDLRAAAREANRRLMAELNHRQALSVSSSRDSVAIVRS